MSDKPNTNADHKPSTDHGTPIACVLPCCDPCAYWNRCLRHAYFSIAIQAIDIGDWIRRACYLSNYCDPVPDCEFADGSEAFIYGNETENYNVFDGTFLAEPSDSPGIFSAIEYHRDQYCSNNPDCGTPVPICPCCDSGSSAACPTNYTPDGFTHHFRKLYGVIVPGATFAYRPLEMHLRAICADGEITFELWLCYGRDCCTDPPELRTWYSKILESDPISITGLEPGDLSGIVLHATSNLDVPAPGTYGPGYCPTDLSGSASALNAGGSALLTMLTTCQFVSDCHVCPPDPEDESAPRDKTNFAIQDLTGGTGCVRSLGITGVDCLDLVIIAWSEGGSGPTTWVRLTDAPPDSDGNYTRVVSVLAVDSRGCRYFDEIELTCGCCGGSGSITALPVGEFDCPDPADPGDPCDTTVVDNYWDYEICATVSSDTCGEGLDGNILVCTGVAEIPYNDCGFGEDGDPDYICTPLGDGDCFTHNVNRGVNTPLKCYPVYFVDTHCCATFVGFLQIRPCLVTGCPPENPVCPGYGG